MPVQGETQPGPEFVNGDAVSHSEMKVIGHTPGSESLDFAGVKELVSQTTVAVGTNGGGPRPIYRSSGRNSYTNSLIFATLADKRRVVRQLTAIAKAAGLVREGNKVRWGLVKFTLEVSFFWPGEDDGHIRVLELARFVDEAFTATEGEAVIETAMVLHVMDAYDKDPLTGEISVIN